MEMVEGSSKDFGAFAVNGGREYDFIGEQTVNINQHFLGRHGQRLAR
jgi:hypothetical protein